MKKTLLILSFAIVAIGFAISLYKSATGNGLLEEDLDQHITAQLYENGDDTGGDDTTGGDGTGGDKTGGDDTSGGSDSLNYKKDEKLISIPGETTIMSDDEGNIYFNGDIYPHFDPDTHYIVEFVNRICIGVLKENCNRKKEGLFIININPSKFQTPSI